MPEQSLKVGMVSLGCAKNLVDAEHMLGLLKGAGYELTNQQAEADVLVINTCTFIGPAKQESVDTILELAEMKKRGRCRALVVAGCMAQRYPADILKELPEVDAVIGTGDFPQIAQVVERVLGGDRVQQVGKAAYQYDAELPRVPTRPGLSGYLKISEGCDHDCAFCIIPRVRGEHRSRPFDALEHEARQMVAAGVRELNLIAQDSTAYGMDRDGRRQLPELLRRLNGIDDLAWMRILYAYPTLVDGHLIEAMATLPKVAKYLDIPLQHASDRVLHEMRRGGNRKLYEDLLRRLRAAVPDITLRSTFIVGFPGETEADFEELLGFLRQARFDNVGVFAYSQEEDTTAGERPDQIPDEVKQSRFQRAMAVQQEIAFEAARRWVGQTVPVLVESVRGKRVTGRIAAQAPDIDGVTLLRGEAFTPQTVVTARITGTKGYDLVGEV